MVQQQSVKQRQLDELRNRILDEVPVPLLAAQAQQLVFGTGNCDADIMFIGEAPGKKEDATGEPFVGASGKLLDALLASIGMKRSEVYITNIVKYRPENNRDPSQREKDAFWPYLLEQVAIIAPKIIATLGRHSGQAFIQDLRIGVDHGTPIQGTFTSRGTALTATVIPLYHPAAAMYNPALRESLFIDFQTLQTAI